MSANPSLSQRQFPSILGDELMLIHFSPSSNRVSITEIGLDPGYDRRGACRLWFAAPGSLRWARQHVAKHQGCRPAFLDAWAVLVEAIKVYRHRGNIFYTRQPVAPDKVLGIVHAPSVSLACQYRNKWPVKV